MILVTGGCGSGKSAYAEYLLTKTEESGACHRESAGRYYYIATMQVREDEDRIRVDKHRKMREGKGFRTIEQPADIIDVLDKIRAENGGLPGGEAPELSVPASEGARDREPVCALLESISNLTANEMFRDEGTGPVGPCVSSDVAVDRIVGQVSALDDALDGLVVVTDNVFEDGTEYEPSTMEYLRALGEINRRLAARACRVIEVAAGIPVELKSL